MINRLVSRLHLDKYFSSKLILAIDLCVSVLASVLAFAFLRTLVFTTSLPIKSLLIWFSGSFVASFAVFYIFKTYRSIIRHSSLRELARLCAAVFVKDFILLAFAFVVYDDTRMIFYLVIMDFLIGVSLLLLVRTSMIVVYDILCAKAKDQRGQKQVLIYGTHDKSVALLKRLTNSPHYKVIGFVIYGEAAKKQEINGEKIYYFNEQDGGVEYFRDKLYVDAVLFSKDSDVKDEQNRLISLCMESDIKVLLAPAIDEIVGGGIVRNNIREIKIEDLLGRSEIKISMENIIESFKGKVVMVTGAAGSIGSELCNQLASFGISRLILYDNAETPMHNLRLHLEEKYPDLDYVPVIGDVRIPARLDFAFRNFHPDVVFHAAAYKHVPLMEENPCEAVWVNVVGTRNVADKCVEYGVSKMVMVSTDKAVNPTNIMGCSKRLAEIYVQALGLAIEKGELEGKTKFVTTRFGNVLGSNGSVIPRFREQIEKGGPVTVTHPDIVRFFMTIPEACRLVMEAAVMTSGNQIFVFDMGESVKIDHLARKMISLAGYKPDKDIKIVYSGLRPGEKLYEEVLANTENTMPTSHERIMIAKVREYDYATADSTVNDLEHLSRIVDIPSLVRLMKKTVPEFISKNSKYEAFDK